MKQIELSIQGESGLHARPASLLVATAQKFEASIEIEKAGHKINAKSIMGILSLGATKGDVVTLHIEGSDEQDAAEAMTELFNNTLVHA